MSILNIDYSDKKKKFVITCPFERVDVARNIPSRRFDPKAKNWVAPVVRANIDYLKSVRNAEWTLPARLAIKGWEEISALPKKIPFPRDYEFGEIQPMDHQLRMLDEGWNFPAKAYFAAMGTGKTYMSIHMACARFKAGQINRLVILCPITLRKNWQREFEKFATVPFEYKLHERSDLFEKWAKEQNPKVLKILAVSVEGLGISERLYDSALAFLVSAEGGKMIICDESSRIKNPQAARTVRAIMMAHNCDYRIILNGTPIANGVQDLYSQYEFLDPNIIGIGDDFSFRLRYLEMGGYENKQIVGYTNLDELIALIKPWTVEVDKSVLKLPPKLTKRYDVQPTPAQLAAIRQAKTAIPCPSVDGVIPIKNVLERFLRMQQIVGGHLPKARLVPVGPDGDTKEVVDLFPFEQQPKLEALVDILKNHPGKAIIWSGFRPEIAMIADRLREEFGHDSVVEYHGGVDEEGKEDAHQQFQKDSRSDARFFVGNPSTGSLGLNLVAADLMVYYTGTFSFIYRSQSEDRFHRKGQDKSVMIIDLAMEGTVDDIIVEAMQLKISVDEWLKRNLNDPRTKLLLD